MRSIDVHRLFKQALATQAASDLRFCLPLLLLLPLLPLLILFSSASLSSFHLACTSTSLGAISLRFQPVSFHAAVCCQARGSYIVLGATLLGAVLIWYTINRLLQPALATQAASVLRLCLRLPFFRLAEGNEIIHTQSSSRSIFHPLSPSPHRRIATARANARSRQLVTWIRLRFFLGFRFLS